MVSISPGQTLCLLEDIPDGGAIAVDAVLADGEDSIIVLREGGHVRAYLNVCPHAGRRLDWAPGQFLVKAGVLVCAAHGASFATASGLCTMGPCRGEHLRKVEVHVSEESVVLGRGADAL
ncbi:Rieske (2Fe-2S) protein [Pinirhizobacter soli]|uniref:Rieske (2Fe-2S) protein n=1 Tax=Pinirhizobacter soli TaxID=2786953 RepID=UPI002029DF47|nr:Rieske 2Fe-2S domain-containing protein [Pinirhizobacter soli]